jgi:hypothetical protein
MNFMVESHVRLFVGALLLLMVALINTPNGACASVKPKPVSKAPVTKATHPITKSSGLSPLPVPNLATKTAAPLNHTEQPASLVIMATAPQEAHIKAYGDTGSLIGGMMARHAQLELKEWRVLSPLEVQARLQYSPYMPHAERLLHRLDVKQGLSQSEMRALLQGIGESAGPTHLLVVRSDVDFTRPYAPQTRWAKFKGWFRDELNEEAWGYVDVDIVRYDRNAQGEYMPHHQWQGSFRLPTDRVVGANTTVYADPTANTWVSQVGHEVFQAYWKDHAADYGKPRNVNPLNRLPMPARAQLKLDEARFPQAHAFNEKIDAIPVLP